MLAQPEPRKGKQVYMCITQITQTKQVYMVYNTNHTNKTSPQIIEISSHNQDKTLVSYQHQQKNRSNKVNWIWHSLCKRLVQSTTCNTPKKKNKTPPNINKQNWKDIINTMSRDLKQRVSFKFTDGGWGRGRRGGGRWGQTNNREKSYTLNIYQIKHFKDSHPKFKVLL